MGYRIDYQPIKKVRGLEKRSCRRTALTFLSLLLFFLLTWGFWPEGRALLQEALIPGDNAVTVTALENLSNELSAGTELSQALEIFCMDILEGAELDPY